MVAGPGCGPLRIDEAAKGGLVLLEVIHDRMRLEWRNRFSTPEDSTQWAWQQVDATNVL